MSGCLLEIAQSGSALDDRTSLRTPRKFLSLCTSCLCCCKLTAWQNGPFLCAQSNAKLFSVLHAFCAAPYDICQQKACSQCTSSAACTPIPAALRPALLLLMPCVSGAGDQPGGARMAAGHGSPCTLLWRWQAPWWWWRQPFWWPGLQAGEWQPL